MADPVRPPEPYTYHEIACELARLHKLVAAHFRISQAVVNQRSHARADQTPRHLFCLIARDTLFASWPAIARMLDRDHTTIISSYKRARVLLERSASMRSWLETIRNHYLDGAGAKCIARPVDGYVGMVDQHVTVIVRALSFMGREIGGPE